MTRRRSFYLIILLYEPFLMDLALFYDSQTRDQILLLIIFSAPSDALVSFLAVSSSLSSEITM